MSVAFRRDSDEEHREPRFEIPLPSGPNLVTERGLAQIRARIQQLQDQLAAEPPEAERTEAERDLRYWKTRQATAQIAPTPDGEEVAIGTRVTIRANGEQRTLCIVGHDEANPAAGYVSFAAPLAVAILGSCVGDRVKFAGKPEAVEILEIVPLS